MARFSGSARAVAVADAAEILAPVVDCGDCGRALPADAVAGDVCLECHIAECDAQTEYMAAKWREKWLGL